MLVDRSIDGDEYSQSNLGSFGALTSDPWEAALLSGMEGRFLLLMVPH
jgi:hypothetical protein